MVSLTNIGHQEKYMRTTRDALLKIARDTAEKAFIPNPNITAAFLVGSMLSENPFMGSTADIDLLVIYNGIPPREREIIKLSNDIHLDIRYESAELYAQPRELRGDPWRGYNMWDPLLLHQKARFFEYTQSIVRSQFDEPANRLKRAYAFSAPARTAWTEMQLDPASAQPLKLLNAAADAANTVAVLSGAPIPERRLLAEFPARANKLENPELVKGLLDIIAAQVTVDFVREWLPAWEAAFIAGGYKPVEARVHIARLGYYKAAIQTLLESDFPLAAVWPMLFTWALAAETGNLTSEHKRAWAKALAQLKLDSSGMTERLDALDHFLDILEETLEQIVAKNGL
jgi:hypothetical protein